MSWDTLIWASRVLLYELFMSNFTGCRTIERWTVERRVGLIDLTT